MDDFFYNGVWRMDWGLGNPNKTAALIATLMVGSWGLAYLKKWGYWLALILFTGLGICLIHTFSRGGLLALIIGMLPMGLSIRLYWSRSRMAGAFVSIGLLIAVSLYLSSFQRLGQGILTEDRSISNRLELWKMAPAMMVDAPLGWGLGNSGKVYAQWYQPLGHEEGYRTLVNSHLTWLVEVGWLGRLIYVFIWIGIFLFCWPSREEPWFAIPLGIWLAFAVTATFSSVAESAWLWIVPCLALCTVAGSRIRKRSWPAARVWCISGVASITVLIFFAIFGLVVKSDFKLSGGRDWVVFGPGKPLVWVVWNQKFMGTNFGKTLRSTNQDGVKRSTVGIAMSWKGLPQGKLEKIVVGGALEPNEKVDFSQAVNRASRVVLINPFFYPEEVGFPVEGMKNVDVAVGEFSQSPAAEAWAKMPNFQRLQGVGDFLPAWMKETLGDY